MVGYMKKKMIIMMSIRAILIAIVMIIAYYAEEKNAIWLSLIGFIIAFCLSLYAHRFFMPFLSFSLLFFLLAITTEMRTDSYQYTEVSRVYWLIGNSFLVIGLLDFIYKIRKVYHVINRTE